MDMGLGGMGAAAGAGDAIAQIQDQRMKAIQLAQQDALVRLKAQEQADEVQSRLEQSRQAEADRQQARQEMTAQRIEQQNRLNFPMLPRTGINPQTVQSMTTGPGALPSDLFPAQPTTAAAPPPAIAAPDDTGAPEPMPGTIANTPAPAQQTFTRLPTPQEAQQDKASTAQQKLMALYPIGSPQRTAIEYEMATGKNAPAGLVGGPKPSTEAEMDAAFQSLDSKRRMGQPLSPQEQSDYDAYKARKLLVPTTTFSLNQPQKDDARVDRSFDARSKELEALRKPIADRSDNIAELEDQLNQGTPQADALVAPKLLSVMVGGQGSGLRMNEAEISRVVGGRSKWEDLKAAMQKWSTNPETANSITADQRKQIRDLVASVKGHTAQKLDLVNKAFDALIDAGDVNEHRRILSQLRSDLSDATQGGPAAPAGGGKTYHLVNGQWVQQ